MQKIWNEIIYHLCLIYLRIVPKYKGRYYRLIIQIIVSNRIAPMIACEQCYDINFFIIDDLCKCGEPCWCLRFSISIWIRFRRLFTRTPAVLSCIKETKFSRQTRFDKWHHWFAWTRSRSKYWCSKFFTS